MAWGSCSLCALLVNKSGMGGHEHLANLLCCIRLSWKQRKGITVLLINVLKCNPIHNDLVHAFIILLLG